MNGQWVGTYSGTNTGTLVVDLDDERTSYRGVVSAYDDNWALPRTYAHIEIPKGQEKYSTSVTLHHIERGTGLSLNYAAVAARFPGVTIPKSADVDLVVRPNSMSVTWKSNIGTTAGGEIFKSAGGKPSTLKPMPEVKSWKDFTEFVRGLEPYQFLYRGHSSNQWRLRTSFHRTGRASLVKFHQQDVTSLHRHLSGLTTHRFDLGDPQDYAAFLVSRNITDILRRCWIGRSLRLLPRTLLLEKLVRKPSPKTRCESSFSTAKGGHPHSKAEAF